ncbi:uncharacterized protein scimp [Aplochiton taeniatus]
MGSLREYFWLLVIIGMIFVSVAIGITFFFVNKCIIKKADENETISNNTYSRNNKYHPKDIEEDLPPLPPRTQFSTEAQSYENLAEQLDYVKVDEDQPPPYQSIVPEACKDVCHDRDSVSTEAYDDIGVDDNGQEEEDYDDIG